MRKEKAVSYVSNSLNNLPEYRFKNFNVFVHSALLDNVSLQNVFQYINRSLPDHFAELVDVVYIGNFSFLKDKGFNALYQDGALYISNEQDNDDDLKDDIIHEIAHAVEEKHADYIYGDNNIKNEYFAKIKKLKSFMMYDGVDVKNVNFFNESYSKDFDIFLSQTIGYDTLRKYIKDIFLAPYSMTSLKEYFARGFEEYFLGDIFYLKQMCPYVYKKINNLYYENEDM